MQLAGVFESDAAEVVAAKLRERSEELLAGRDADPALVAAHLGAIVGLDVGAEAHSRDALFGSARQFLESAAREQPTILVFEDIHWADANLLDFIETFASRARDLPLLLVTLSRPELLDTRPGWATGLSAYTALTVPRSGDEHARELAARKLGDADAVDEVIRRRRGQPALHRAARRRDRRDRVGHLPTSVRALVAARLDALPRAERALLIDAAVVGQGLLDGRCRGDHARAADLGALLEELERRDLDPPRDRSIIGGPAAVRVHSRPDPRRRLRPAAARRPRPAPRARSPSSSRARQACRARRSARSHATGATPATIRARRRAARARRRRRRSAAGRRITRRCSTARRWSSCRQTTPSRGASLRRRLAIALRRRSIWRCQTAGKSAGVTSPAISSIESTLCLPSRSECSTTMSSLGAA